MELGMKLVYIAMVVMMCAAIEAPWLGFAQGVDNIDPQLMIRSSPRIGREFLDAYNKFLGHRKSACVEQKTCQDRENLRGAAMCELSDVLQHCQCC